MMTSNNQRPFRPHKWQIAGVIIASMTLLWSVGWNMYVHSTQANIPVTISSLPTATANTFSSNPQVETPTPAATASAVLCYGTGCDGKHPEDYGCLNDQVLISASNIEQAQTTVATVEFYVSQSCAAGWVNIETPQDTTGNLSAEVNNGGYVQQYCYPRCPVAQHYQPDRQNVHTVMIHTNRNYTLWGRGCYFPSPTTKLCFPDENTSEFEFQGSWF